jgi:hypothetical protein
MGGVRLLNTVAEVAGGRADPATLPVAEGSCEPANQDKPAAFSFLAALLQTVRTNPQGQSARNGPIRLPLHSQRYGAVLGIQPIPAEMDTTSPPHRVSQMV